jgi:hypothetical protein
MRTRILNLLLGLSLAACDDGGAASSIAIPDAVDATIATDTAVSDSASLSEDLDVVDASEVEVLYPGYTCGGDDQCSTGLCYGAATQQGAFEPAKCQTKCLDTFDFSKYCDSDDDCCKGRCCIGCGAREGLCVLD